MKKRIVDSENCLTPLYGKHCWDARYGLDTNLTLKFGNPRLEIIEPPQTKKITRSDFLFHERRWALVCGEWYFCLEISYFRILRKGVTLVSRSSSCRNIWKVLKWLDGQKLVRAEVNNRTGKTRLDFDKGGAVEIRRCQANSTNELWCLSGPTSYCSIYGDGTFKCTKRTAD